jgi:hypothetical protein
VFHNHFSRHVAPYRNQRPELLLTVISGQGRCLP